MAPSSSEFLLSGAWNCWANPVAGIEQISSDRAASGVPLVLGMLQPGLLSLHSHLFPYPTAFAFLFWSIWLHNISPWLDGFFHISPMLLIELLSGKFYSVLRPAGDACLVAKGSWEPFFMPSLVLFSPILWCFLEFLIRSCFSHGPHRLHDLLRIFKFLPGNGTIDFIPHSAWWRNRWKSFYKSKVSCNACKFFVVTAWYSAK